MNEDWIKEQEEATAENYRVILCGANAYEKKYYFNRKFDKIPENIKEELHIICVLFTEEVGGVFTIGFTPYGEVEMDAQKDEEDLLYDEIGAELLKKEIRRKKADMLRALSIYFKVTFLGQDAAALLEEEDEEECRRTRELSGTGQDAEQEPPVNGSNEICIPVSDRECDDPQQNSFRTDGRRVRPAIPSAVP